MYTAHIKLKGISPYTQGKALVTPRKAKETADQHEKKCWKERAHTDENGICLITRETLMNTLCEGASFLGMKLEGKRTFTKSFERGIMILNDASLGVHIDDVKGQAVFLPADGKRGGTTRVWRTFPIFHEWEAEFDLMVLDERIDEDTLKKHIEEAGKFIGFGTYRPTARGTHGRFRLVSMTTDHEVEDE